MFLEVIELVFQQQFEATNLDELVVAKHRRVFSALLLASLRSFVDQKQNFSQYSPRCVLLRIEKHGKLGKLPAN